MLLFFSIFVISSQQTRRHHRNKKPTPQEPDRDDIFLDPPKEDILFPDVKPVVPDKKDFENTILLNDGTRICKDGYIGESPINSLGCWKCLSLCDPIETCKYPGICVAEVPVISKHYMKKINNSDSIVVTFKLSQKFANVVPTKGFCRFDQTIKPASLTTANTIYCPQPKIDFSKLAISFDGKSWSENQNVITKKMSSGAGQKSFVVILMLIGAVCVFASGFLFARYCNKSNNFGKPSTHSTSHSNNDNPLAYFPQVEGEKERRQLYY